MDYEKILELIREMNQTQLTQIEIEEEGFRLHLEKAANTATEVQYNMPAMNANAAALVSVPQPSISSEKEVTEEDNNGEKMLSPMVGTFYAQPSPDKPPFVKVGDKVRKGQTLCIIEAMKLMNEIESEYDGEVLKVLTKNEEMVEFGQPLFVIA